MTSKFIINEEVENILREQSIQETYLTRNISLKYVSVWDW